MKLYDFMMMFNKFFGVLEKKDQKYIELMQPLVEATDAAVMERALESMASQFDTQRTGIFPKVSHIEAAVKAFTHVKSDRSCIVCLGCGYVRCATDKNGNPVPSGEGLGTMEVPETVNASDHPCPVCRGMEYEDYRMKEAVKRFCRSVHTPFSVVREQAYKPGSRLYVHPDVPHFEPSHKRPAGAFPGLESVQRNIDRDRSDSIVAIGGLV